MLTERKIDTREDFAEFLEGGFAPVIPLLKEFRYDKAGEVLDGLHFSAYSLLLHMEKRQITMLNFMKDPMEGEELWPEAYWPEKYSPDSEEEWNDAIARFESDLNEIIKIVIDNKNKLFEQQENGKSVFWAAVSILQHNAYHIGQLKTIGRQLGVW